jgi:iron complex outermembrane receptor protein
MMQKQVTISKISLAITFALTASCAHAEQKNEVETLQVLGEQTQYYRVQQNQSALKIEVPLLEVPQAVSVVTQQEIQDKEALTLSDAIKGVPGITSPSGEGARDHFTIRGYDALYDVYRNGLRDGSNNQAFRSMANIERIEVIKGPAGALYGRGSAGGLINLVIKKADRDVAEVKLQGGSFNRVGVSADLGASLTDTFSSRINLEYKQGDSHIDRADYETLFIAPTFRLELGQSTLIDLDIEYMDQSVTPIRGIPSVDGKPIDIDNSTSYTSASDFQENTFINSAVSVQHQFNEKINWSNKLYYSQVEMEQAGTRNVKVEGDMLQRKVVAFAFDPQEDMGFQSELNMQLGINQLLVGFDANRMERVSTSGGAVAPSTPLYNPTDFTYARPELSPNRSNQVDSTSLYFQDVVSIGDAWKVLLGARYDWITSNQDKADGSNFEIKDDNLSPRAGIVFLPSDNSSIYTTIGRSYSLPWGGIYAAPTKSALLKTDLMEIGFKIDFLDNRATFNSALFNIERENAETNDQGVVVDVNNDKHQGIELELKGELLEDWQLSTGYTYLDAENQDTGYRPNDVPEHTASLWNTYKISPAFKIGGGITYIGDRYVGGNESVKLDAYNTVDLMASYEWKAHLIQLNVNNATNQEYFTGATRGGSGSTQINQGAPANFNITYSYAFM